MNFDDQMRLAITPQELHGMAEQAPSRLLREFLMVGTPRVFGSHRDYCNFLEAVSERTGIHRKNLYVRGSCHIGFSIAPKVDKVWFEVAHGSDLDLAIVDAAYFYRCEEELRHWEARNPPKDENAKRAAAYRSQDRRFNLFRDKPLPNVVCVHHAGTMEKVAALAHCGHRRDVSAFIYPDWHSAEARYRFDLRELCEGVRKGNLLPPPARPFPRQPAAPVTPLGNPPEPPIQAVAPAVPAQPDEHDPAVAAQSPKKNGDPK